MKAHFATSVDGARISIGSIATCGFGTFFIKGALPDAVKGVQMAVLAESFSTFFSAGSVRLTCLAKSLDLLRSGMIGPECTDEIGRFYGDCTYSLGAAVEEGFGHGRLIGILNSPIETIVSALKGHLNEGVWGEAHGGHEILAVAFEF